MKLEITGADIKYLMLQYIYDIDVANIGENGFTEKSKHGFVTDEIQKFYSNKSFTYIADVFEQYGGLDEN